MWLYVCVRVYIFFHYSSIFIVYILFCSLFLFLYVLYINGHKYTCTGDIFSLNKWDFLIMKSWASYLLSLSSLGKVVGCNINKKEDMVTPRVSDYSHHSQSHIISINNNKNNNSNNTELNDNHKVLCSYVWHIQLSEPLGFTGVDWDLHSCKSLFFFSTGNLDVIVCCSYF